MRIQGHALRAEGKAYRAACCGELDLIGVRMAWSSIGHGLCECGAMSGPEDSDADRKKWHREHKESLRVPSVSHEPGEQK